MDAATPAPNALSFAAHGAQLYAGAASTILDDLFAALAGLPNAEPGLRLRELPSLRPQLGPSGAIGGVAASILGERSRPVRAILFDKNPAANWALGWHQDRTICVAARAETEGFGPWTLKSGLHHVEPPFDLLASMVTLRVHLDDVPSDNAPLLIAPGSHRLGRIPEGEIEAAARVCGTVACTARAGDVWLYATPILHASRAAARPARRRVLQVDYAARDLPAGLDWLGL
ncbi:MAG TPA: phytanoyl-CoA dioxygenase family protein [Allosphingosinicella sp.]|nr:phytanoyl-CoA dioxygenase family protein [Allosphingosinicella sp.]